MGKTLYIGIIGWNATTEFLARTFHFELRDTEIIALATTNPEGQRIGREVLGLKHVFSDPHPLYELHQLDFICIDSSAEFHLDEVTKSLNSGVDLLVDHPLSSNVTDCLSIEKVVRSNPSQKVMFSLPRRFDPILKTIKNKLDSQKIGNIISISVENYEAFDVSRKDTVFAASKGIFMDLTLQDIDMVRWLTGEEFTSVFARGSAEKYPSLKKHNDVDTAFISASMDDQILVNFFCTRVGLATDGYCLHIIGTKGEIKYDSRPSPVKMKTHESTESFKPILNTSNYSNLLKYFISTRTEGNRLPYKVEEGTVATKVAVAMTKSFVLGDVINIE